MTNDDEEYPKLCVKTIQELVKEKLTIPEYQRPYKWESKHVERLLKDIEEHRENKDNFKYRIGTIVIHKDEEDGNQLKIVDGQQRVTTLALILLALVNLKEKEIKNKKNNIKDDKEIELENFLEHLKYDHTLSQNNIIQNYENIKNFIKGLGDKKEDFKNFLLQNCEVVYIILDDIDEAFQFFDSQNARGKSLAGYDLLKAFHLREMGKNTHDEKIEVVRKWETASQKNEKETNLKVIFNDLFAIRKYSKGEKVGRNEFTKKDVDEFKGFNPLKHDYPYIQSYLMNDIFLKKNKQDIEDSFLLIGKIKKINYPFQINMQILNGKRFFEYIDFYIELKESLKKNSLKNFTKQYADELYKRVLLFYYDKFGNSQLEEAINFCYAWVFILFENLQTLQFASIDNKGANGSNGKYITGKSLFPVIRDAVYHNQVTGLEVKNQLENEWNTIKKNIKEKEKKELEEKKKKKLEDIKIFEII